MQNRIKSVRKELGLSQENFGNRIGVSRDVIVNIELGRAALKPRLLKHICEVFGVNEDWLQTGNGEMFLPVSDEMQLRQIMTEIAISDDDLIKKIIQSYWKLDDKEKALLRKMVDSLLQ